MRYIAKFVCGNRSIPITGNYELFGDFTPPDGSGDFSFQLRITGSSSAEVQRSKEILEQFLLSGTLRKPVYFEFREYAIFDSGPIIGQHGANKRIVIYDWSISWWDKYSAGDLRMTAAVIEIRMSHGAIIGTRQLAASAKGGIAETLIGSTDGLSQGLTIPLPDTTYGNYITNPIFGHSTYNTGWTATAALTVTKNSDQNYILFGLASAQIVSSGLQVAAAGSSALRKGGMCKNHHPFLTSASH